MRVWYGAPYVQNADKDLYQKFPTFRIQFFNSLGISMGNSLLQDYPDSDLNTSNLFPFGESMIDQYMRPIFDCYSDRSFPRGMRQLLRVVPHGDYIDAPKNIPLETSSSTYIIDFHTRNVKIYQSQAYPYQSMVASKITVESVPAGDSVWGNKGISTDPWDRFNLRMSDDSSRYIMQQIADVHIESIGSQRNVNLQNFRRDYGFPTWIMHSEIANLDNYNSTYGVRPLVNGNPRAPIMGRTAHQDDKTASGSTANFIPGNWYWQAKWGGICAPSGNFDSSLGNDALLSFKTHSEFQNLFDLPESIYKFFNLGFLQHMNAGCFSYHPAYAFGNSFQNPHILRDRFFQENDPIPGSTWLSHNRVEMLYDYSYCLNRALWDSYFIASTGQTIDPPILINPRQKAFIGANGSNLNSFKDAAENMAIHGAFNVNSTSQNAWAAFLGSTAGNFIGNDTTVEYSRIQTIDSTSGTGWRQLSPGQTLSLAERLILQIKRRGIAGSIGEFVNRKLLSRGNDPYKLGIKGALQTAIDEVLAPGGSNVPSSRGRDWFDDEAASGPFWACKPGELTQADILQSTATTLCARGDTFCIHAYGNALDAKGNIEAETRCEAIVQRLPELIDPNKPDLGRRYKILAIKWITPPPLTINLPISSTLFSNFGEGNVKVQTMWAINGFLHDNTGGVSSALWATAGHAEGIAKGLTTFLSDLQSLSPEAAAAKLAQNISSLSNIFVYSIMQDVINNEKSDPQTGASVSAFLDAYNATINALSGSSSITQAKQAISAAMGAIENFTNSSAQNKTDYENSIKAIQAANDYAAQYGNSGDNSTYTSQHAQIKDAFTGALNGTSYSSDGTQIANLTVALSSLENALNLYQDAK
jgi:hypothetical protein